MAMAISPPRPWGASQATDGARNRMTMAATGLGLPYDRPSKPGRSGGVVSRPTSAHQSIQ